MSTGSIPNPLISSPGDINELVTSYCKALEQGDAAIFAGAGLSIPAGFVNWKELLTDIANELGLNIDQEHDLISVAQYHQNTRGNRNKINQTILDEFSSKATLTENHRILARLPISTFWTTNYDPLIEKSLDDEGKTPDTKIHNDDLSLTKTKRDAVVYKMHGDIGNPASAVITRDDYEHYQEKRPLFVPAFHGDLVSKTFIFLGFSFSDPNIGYLLARMRILLGQNQRQHYCIMRAVQRSDHSFKCDSEYMYARTKQELQIQDLKRYAVKTILVNAYRETTEILKKIESRYKRRRIFWGGSADDFSPWSKNKVEDIIHSTSKIISEAGFHIATGFGLGIGGAVVNGVLERLYATKYRRIDEYLTLRPFPQSATGTQTLAESWHQYRESIISQCGIAIFMFGNKNAGGCIVEADGLKKEFDIAIAQGVRVIPIGITGWMSKTLWDIVNKDLDHLLSSDPNAQSEFKKLGDPATKLEEVADILIRLLKILRNS